MTVVGIGDAVRVAAGSGHTCAIRADKSVWCWGNAEFGQLGHDAAPAAGSMTATPAQVQGVTDAVDVATGQGFSCVLHGITSTVSCFGEDDDGRLGSMAVAAQHVYLPAQIPNLSGVRSLATSSNNNTYMCAVLDSGGVVCWGNNEWGQLGNGTKVASVTPTAFQNVSDVREVSVGFSVTCALENDGDVWCAGTNALKQLAQPSGTEYLSAVQVDLGGEPAKAVACSNASCCALLDTGPPLCWGYNRHGQVANGAFTRAALPPHACRASSLCPTC